MSEFDFKSQICTTREQSERLLSLGLKKETADMVYVPHYVNGVLKDYFEPKVLEKKVLEYMLTDEAFKDYIPAWSLHRLIEMMPEEMYGGLLCIFKDSIRYEELIMDRPEAHFEVVGDDMYENAISCIEWLIKEGYFNKEYLEE